jgi:putative ABC transport system permease protein
MFLIKLLFKNAFRHKLRTILTMLGLVVAISSFGLLNTVVEAWYAGVDATSNTRLVTRSAISIGYPLPITYAARMSRVDGVKRVTWANWFGGYYIDKKNRFPQFAVDGASYFDIYPEYVLSPEEREAFMKDRRGVVLGRKTAERFGWKVGDNLPLTGTIYPGTWTFTVRGIYHGADEKVDETTMLLHWQMVSDTVKKTAAAMLGSQVGVYMVQVKDPSQTSTVSQEIDGLFRNSAAETRTETEKSFQLGLVAMSESILLVIRAVSFVVILIIMAVMANTMSMTARERLAEYATLRALGFKPSFVVKLLFGESLAIVVLGCIIGVAVTFPLASTFVKATGNLFKVFHVSTSTIGLQIAAALAVGLIAAAWPAWKMSRIDIVNGLRHVA